MDPAEISGDHNLLLGPTEVKYCRLGGSKKFLALFSNVSHPKNDFPHRFVGKDFSFYCGAVWVVRVALHLPATHSNQS